DCGQGRNDELHQLVRQGIGGNGQRQHPPAQSGERERERDGQRAWRDGAGRDRRTRRRGLRHLPVGYHRRAVDGERDPARACVTTRPVLPDVQRDPIGLKVSGDLSSPWRALMSKMRAVRLLCLASAALLALVLVISTVASRPATIKSKPIASTGAWTTYHHDNARTGYDSTLPLVQSVSTGWTSGAMDGQVYASPLVFNGVVYAATLNNTVYAFNQSTGATMWSKNLGAPQASGWICGNVSPMGILSTPVIDAAANRIYAATEIAGATPTYHLFGLDLAASGNIVLNTDIIPVG